MKTLLVFTQDEADCHWCKRYNPVLNALAEQGVLIEKVYAFTPEGEHNPLNKTWNVLSTPTTIVLENGVEVDRFLSAKPLSYVLDKLKD